MYTCLLFLCTKFCTVFSYRLALFKKNSKFSAWWTVIREKIQKKSPRAQTSSMQKKGFKKIDFTVHQAHLSSGAEILRPLTWCITTFFWLFDASLLHNITDYSLHFLLLSLATLVLIENYNQLTTFKVFGSRNIAVTNTVNFLNWQIFWNGFSRGQRW